ncbi:hypothetical protein [Micromonospora echinofusca]|nr:hypothetical protein [Micromonospora echinofusca]
MKLLRIPARRLLSAVAVLGLVPALAVPVPAQSAPVEETSSVDAAAQKYDRRLLAKAVPDECFAGVGAPYPAGPPCAEGQAKVNQSYLWGMTRADQHLWFGTGANINCLTSGRNLKSTDPNLNEDWVCEYGESQIAKRNPSLPATLGDHRPPRMYQYDLHTGQSVEKTALVKNAGPEHANRLSSTAGIRAAGNHQGVVLLAGPALAQSINLFAFDADTGAFISSTTMPQYGNMRHFVVADNVLYAGVGVGANGSAGGHVLRWTGDKTNPFSFVEVADLPAQAADLTVHQGRIFISTWIGTGDDGLAADGPVAGAADVLAGIWMSPRLADGDPGLTPADSAGWRKVWDVSEYEPDPTVASTYALGGLASYGGQLYWGTMHVPLKATYTHLLRYPPVDEESSRATIQNTQRSISIFRGRNFGLDRQQVDLLYGATELPKYDPAANGGAGAWALVSTNNTPLYGSGGLGNPYNNYTWKMVVAGGRLFVGTMDWSYISKDLGNQAAQQLGLPASAAATLSAAPVLAEQARTRENPPATFGGDLFVFNSPWSPAEVVDNAGFGNYLNYGIRNIVTDGTDLYLGTANPMNLRTDPNDDIPEGGWELIQLRTRAW